MGALLYNFLGIFEAGFSLNFRVFKDFKKNIAIVKRLRA
ncbi:hypothetical protein HPHPP28B_0485 [Helicobacter pylori Hp P-28b]|nr:hypothetical protein HPHPP28B_0485 [Helicobacter pylori Hp P-28b]